MAGRPPPPRDFPDHRPREYSRPMPIPTSYGRRTPSPPRRSYHEADTYRPLGGPSSGPSMNGGYAGSYDDRKRRRSPSPPPGSYGRGRFDDRFAPRPRYDHPGQSSHYDHPPSSSAYPYNGSAADTYRPQSGLGDGAYDSRSRPYPPMSSSLPTRGPSSTDTYIPGITESSTSNPSASETGSSLLERLSGTGITNGGESDRRNGHSNERRDPSSVEYKVPLHYFVGWLRESQGAGSSKRDDDRDVTDEERTKYQEYLRQYKARQLWALFLYHREDPWFVERYSNDPTFLEARQKRFRESAAHALKSYRQKENKKEEADFDATEQDLPARDRKGPKDRRIARTDGPIKGCVFLLDIPKDMSRTKLEEVLGQFPGFRHVNFTDPNPRTGLSRRGWAYFSPDVPLESVVQTLKERHPGLGAKTDERPVAGPVHRQSTRFSVPDRMEHDLNQSRQLTAKFAEEAGIDSDAIAALVEEITSGDSSTKKQLDANLAVLRNVFHTCYYCGLAFDCSEALDKRCIRHVRMPLDGEESIPPASGAVDGESDRKPSQTFNAPDVKDEEVKPEAGGPENDSDAEGDKDEDKSKSGIRLDRRLRLLISSHNELDPSEYDGKNKEVERNKISDPLIKKEEEGKFRCRQCSKLFKAPEFLYKHIPTKHPELFQEQEATLALYDNFVLDPRRLEPRHDQPASVNDKLPVGEIHPPPAPPQNSRQSLSERIQGSFRAKPSPSSNRFKAPPKVPTIHPQGLKEDPRAKKGKIGYRDLDAPGGAEEAGLPW